MPDEIDVAPVRREVRTTIADRSVHLDDATTQNIEVDDSGTLSPEEAIAQAHRTAEDREAEATRLRGETQAANVRASRAERELQRANVGRQNERQGTLAAEVSGAKAEKSAAIAAKRAAREMGDIDAELKADDALSAANFRLLSAEAELAQVKMGTTDPVSSAGNVREVSAGNNDGGPTAEAQNWIDQHPRFNTDKGYRDAVLASHAAALKDGILADSPAYFKALNETAAALEGSNGGQHMDNGNGQTRRPGFNGAPSSRGNGGGSGGGKTVQTGLGPVTVYTKNDGSKTVSVPKHLRADFEEGAKICNMDLGAYILDMAEQGNNGLIMTEGQSYR